MKLEWPWIALVVGLVMAAAGRGAPNGRVIFLGDSLTSGYNIQPTLAYPSLIEQRLRAKGYTNPVVNAGVSGDTTAGAVRRLQPLLIGDVSLVVITIGGNDGLRGTDLKTTRTNVAKMLQMTRDAHVPVILSAMEIPDNYGPSYVKTFREMYPQLAQEYHVPLMPFVLKGVAMDPELNLPDLIHPNAKGHAKVAENVWSFLEPRLKLLK